MKINIQEIKSFLQEANKTTYANKEASKTQSLRPKSEDYHFEKGYLTFHDTYFGARDFLGEEVVYKNNEPVWAMNYYGHVLKSKVATQDAYRILRPALMQDDEGIIPVRGPREYKNANHTYQNKIEGDLSQFNGVEEILIDGDVVYRGLFHGGFIKYS